MRPLIITYGDPKTGKTLAAVRAFPDGLFITPKGGLMCSKWMGWEPKVIETEEKQLGILDLIPIIEKAQHKYPAIVIDDFSIMCQEELAKCEKRTPGWQAYGVFNERVRKFQKACRTATNNCHIIITMHSQPPREVEDKGVVVPLKGCPMLPGRQLPKQFPTMADLVARVVHDKKAIGWGNVYTTASDPDWTAGDRLAITPEKFPLNLREVLLLAGYDVPRPEALSFMDEWVDKISKEVSKELINKRPKVKDVLRPFVDLMKKEELDDRHMRWIFADALDRAQLRTHNNNLIDNFIETL